MKRRPSQAKSPLIRLVGLGAVVATAELGGSAALAAPGDLDPSFADVGRQLVEGPLWSIDLPQDAGSMLYAGGQEYCSYYYSECFVDEFTGKLTPDGDIDAGFAATAVAKTIVQDAALQPDGKVVAVGRASQANGASKLQVFRRRTDGSLDPEFGLGGVTVISDGTTAFESAYSVVVDRDGRIVIAGTRDSQLQIVRLLANGTRDPAFGTEGILRPTNPSFEIQGFYAKIAQLPTAGYRVMATLVTPDPGSSVASCGVAAINGDGALDTTFGDAGVARPPSSGPGEVTCSALAVAGDGSVLLGGQRDQEVAYLGRLSVQGQPDPGFSAPAVPDEFAQVTALAIGPAGAIFAAGQDYAPWSGVQALKLHPGGAVDTSFGNQGKTRFDPPSTRAAHTTVTDLAVSTSGALVVGGNISYWGGFVARLLGDGAGGGPGVFSIEQGSVLGTEQAGSVVLTVRRSGGSTGPAAVSYATHDLPENGGRVRALAGVDYPAASSRLSWADGDTGSRQIVFAIAADGAVELPEFFEVALESPEGGAGLGVSGIDVEIAGDGYPAGVFEIASGPLQVSENSGATLWVARQYYSSGEVSVTLRVQSSTADPNSDFAAANSTKWQDTVLTWADGDGATKPVTLFALRDEIDEPTELVSLELVAPTGGAIIGTNGVANIQIYNLNPPVRPNSGSGGSRGGGHFGWLSALLLGFAAVRRRWEANVR